MSNLFSPPGRPDPTTVTWEAVSLLVRRFEICTLPRKRWNHDATLLVGLWYVLHRGPVEALTALRRGLKTYNAITGRTPEERAGYSEQLTRLMVDEIHRFLRDGCDLDQHLELPRLLLAHPMAQPWRSKAS